MLPDLGRVSCDVDWNAELARFGFIHGTWDLRKCVHDRVGSQNPRSLGAGHERQVYSVSDGALDTLRDENATW